MSEVHKPSDDEAADGERSAEVTEPKAKQAAEDLKDQVEDKPSDR